MLSFEDTPATATVEVVAPETELQTENSRIVQKAKSIVITSDAQNAFAANFLIEIKGAAKRVVDFFADSKKKAHEAWKAICANEKTLTDPLEDAERIVKRTMAAYAEAQEKLREEALAKAQAEAMKLQAQAEKALKKGDGEKAEELQVKAAMTAAEVNYIPTKTSGVSYSKVWKWRITDADLIPREYLIPNEKHLNAVAKATGGALKVPGIEFYQETQIAAKAHKQ